mmetsp:Transcript_11127/g.13805  ORF Transcript_11127/g.13805 Transcript_11127/m.13805 type:complete len:233 (+) Transcript_11127:2496-3194(+)
MRSAKDDVTARLNSMGSSGGITLVKMITTCRISLNLLRVGSSHPSFKTTPAAMIAQNTSSKMKKKVSRVFTPSIPDLALCVMVRMRDPCCVSNPVRRIKARHPSLGGGGRVLAPAFVVPVSVFLFVLVSSPLSATVLPRREQSTIVVPPQIKLFFALPSSKSKNRCLFLASSSLTSIASLICGTLSPVKTASFTTAPPLNNNKSHGTSPFTRLTISPATKSSLLTTPHPPSR